MGQPFFRLGISCFFHLCNLRFHGFYQLCELFLAFFSCLCVDIFGDAFAVDSRREPSFVKVVVYHRHASRATLSYLGLVRLKNRFCGVFGVWVGTFLGRWRFGRRCDKIEPFCRTSPRRTAPRTACDRLSSALRKTVEARSVSACSAVSYRFRG